MTEILNDRQRLDMWNEVCLTQGWSKPRELDKWIIHSGLKFSNSGSSVPAVIATVMNKFNLDVIIAAAEGEELATIILQAISGILMFTSVVLEVHFWVGINKRLREEYNLYVPSEIIPKYVKNLYEDDKQLSLFDKI